MDLLSGSDSDSEKKDNGFKINKSYAKSYDRFRQREERQRLMDKYGDADGSESEEEEIRSTPALDKEWLRAFAVVRFNQPRLYSGEKLFNGTEIKSLRNHSLNRTIKIVEKWAYRGNVEEVKPVPKKSEDRKFTLKDQERKFLLEKGGVASDEDEDVTEKQKAGPSYFEEQDEIKRSLKKAIGNFDDDDDNEDSLLVVKEKTKHEERQEENDYLAWLKGEKKDLKDKEASKELEPLKAYWSNPNLSQKEKILRDYILNNGYMDQEGGDDDSSDDEDEDDVDLSEDEEFLDKADKYERTYNFRHEEPGGCEIKSYPRVIETSVRAKEESKRAERRKKLAERKQMEKEERMEEMKMLQKLQRAEKEEKLKKLEELSENPDVLRYLETDFDPEEHDKLMKKHYDDDYYEGEGEDEKPVFEDEEIGNAAYGDDTDEWWNQREQAQENDIEMEVKEEQEEEELYAEDPGFVMDADYDPEAVVPKKSKKEKRKAKKNKKDDKPLYDPTTKTFDEYLDEYLKDKINRLPFTYREVVPIDFGLTTDEILKAEDKELNAWVSVKRMSQYRTKDSEMYDLKKYQRKSKNQYKKYQVIPSLAPKQRVQETETSDIVRPKLPKKKKKEKQNVDDDTGNLSDKKKKQEKKKRKEKLDGILKEEVESSICDETASPKKKKKKEKHVNQQMNVKEETENSICDANDSSSPKKKKKKKGKEQQNSTHDSGLLVKSNKNIQGETSDSTQIKKKNKKKRKHEDLDSATDLSHTENSKKRKREESSFTPESETKKSKKVKKSGNNFTKDTNTPIEFKNKKYRKNFSDLRVDVSESADVRPSGGDKKEVNRNLRMVMSKSRLSSYGLKKGGKKNKANNQDTQE